jgi:hypothetical protein
MLRRQNELRRLAVDLAHPDEIPAGDLEHWAMLFADVCFYRTEGCDLFSFRDAVRPTPLDIDDDMAMEAIHNVDRVRKRRGTDYRPISPTVAGRWLKLTSERCRRCHVSTMSPIDPIPAAEKARLRREADCKRKEKWRLTASPADVDRKRERDREQARRRRAAQGMRPHSQSLSQTRPWEKEGISRTKYDRRARRARDEKVLFRPILLRGVRNDEFSSTPPAAASTRNARNGHGKNPHSAARGRKGVAEQGLNGGAPHVPVHALLPRWLPTKRTRGVFNALTVIAAEELRRQSA